MELTPTNIKRHFYSEKRISGISQGILLMVYSFLESEKTDDDGLLAAAMNMTAPDMLKQAELPDIDKGDFIKEEKSAMILWYNQNNDRPYAKYSDVRKAVYTSYLPENYEVARKFWTLVKRQNISRLPLAGEDLFAWILPEYQHQGIEQIWKFEDENLNKPGVWKGKQPTENRFQWKSPDHAIIQTGLGIPPIAKNFFPFNEINESNLPWQYETEMRLEEKKKLYIKIRAGDEDIDVGDVRLAMTLATRLGSQIISLSQKEFMIDVDQKSEIVIDYGS